MIRALLSWRKIRSLMAPAPGKSSDRTSPSNEQLVTPGTQSTLSGAPKISQSISGATANL